MFFHLIFQVPPTPTPLPIVSSPPIEMPQSLFWDGAADTVGLWNQMNQNNFFTFVQFLAVAIMVVLFLGLLYRAIRQISQ